MARWGYYMDYLLRKVGPAVLAGLIIASIVAFWNMSNSFARFTEQMQSFESKVEYLEERISNLEEDVSELKREE